MKLGSTSRAKAFLNLGRSEVETKMANMLSFLRRLIDFCPFIKLQWRFEWDKRKSIPLVGSFCTSFFFNETWGKSDYVQPRLNKIVFSVALKSEAENFRRKSLPLLRSFICCLWGNTAHFAPRESRLRSFYPRIESQPFRIAVYRGVRKRCMISEPGRFIHLNVGRELGLESEWMMGEGRLISLEPT